MEIKDFQNVTSSLSDEQRNKFKNIISDGTPKTDLMVNVLELLEDRGPYSKRLSEQNKDSLVRLLINYTDSCWPIYFEGVRLEPLFPYMQTYIYHIQAEKGYRVATISEVENGVIGLIAEVKDNIPSKDQQMLKLLQWTFDGGWRNYKSAGFKVSFNDDHTLATTYLQMLKQAATEINDLIDYMTEGKQFDYAVATLRKAKRNGAYKYPAFAFDEVKPDMSIKRLVFSLKNTLPKGSSNPDVRRAWRIILDCEKRAKMRQSRRNGAVERDIYCFEPYEVSFLRKLLLDLNEHASSYSDSIKNQVENSSVSDGLREDCEKLIDGRNRHLIKSDHFVFKIIETLSSRGYRSVSPKQKKVIDSALRELEIASRAKDNQEKMRENVERKTSGSKADSGAIDVDSFDEAQDAKLKSMGKTESDDAPMGAMPDIFDIATMLGDGLIGQL